MLHTLDLCGIVPVVVINAVSATNDIGQRPRRPEHSTIFRDEIITFNG
jgi:hypothetical protein